MNHQSLRYRIPYAIRTTLDLLLGDLSPRWLSLATVIGFLGATYVILGCCEPVDWERQVELWSRGLTW